MSNSKAKKIVKEVVQLALVLTGVLCFRSSIAEPYVVPTGSMEPNILPGDYLFVSKLSYGLKVPFTNFTLKEVGQPKRGDIVVFKFPKDPSQNFVKRLIGLPGDIVEVEDGFLRINGEPLPVTDKEEKDLGNLIYHEKLGAIAYSVQRLPHQPDGMMHRFQVPAHHFFFMGDNRDNSNDSRVWGFVPEENLKGKALLIWLSLDKHGTIPSVRWTRFGKQL